MSVRPNVIRWKPLILSATEGTTLDPALVAGLVDKESHGIPIARNASGATGLTQVKPLVHRDLVARVAGLSPKATEAELTEALMRPEVAIEVGVLHLSWCVRSCGDEAKGLAKYHVGSCVAGSKADSAGTLTRDYVADVMNLRNEYRPHFAPEKETPVVTLAITYGRVPVPEIELRDIVTNGINHAWDDLGERRNLGVCVHRMMGTLDGTDEHFRTAAARSALTDFGIGRDGRIYQWVPIGSRAAPWASGPANDLEGDGIAFVRKLGTAAVNRDLRSIELDDGGNPDSPFGKGSLPAQWTALVALIAYVFDQADVPWNSYPVHPTYGIVTHLEHWEFGPKECPFGTVRAQTTALQADVRAMLKAHQTGVKTPGPVLPPVVVTPIVPYDAAKDQAFLAERFGTAVKYDALGASIGQATYDPAGVISNAWVQRCDAEDVWPSATAWMTGLTGAVTQRVRFSNGWTLNDLGDKRGWVWAGREA